jgi:hypothetical protein
VVVLLNGSFGIGKTTVARLLRRSIPDSAIFDPEHPGFVLRRLPRWVPLKGRHTGDYQDMPLWRTLTISGIRATRLMRRTVIVPMAFTNLEYLRHIRTGVESFDEDVRHFCLIAPLETVKARLRNRGAIDPWPFRRAEQCCAIHRDPAFAEQIEAIASPPEILNQILRRLA